MPDDIRIENKDDLEEWLNSLPEDIRRQAAVAIASRAALRVLPLLSNENDISTILSTFRAIAISWLAAVNKLRAKGFYDSIVATIKINFSETVVGREVSDSAVSVSKAAALAILHPETPHAADEAAIATITHALEAVDSGKESILWEALSFDARFITTSPYAITTLLTEHPLWPDGTPEWAAKYWASMKQRLLAREDEHWEVWTNWYDARLAPSRRIPCYSPPDLELEEARVLLLDKLWKQGHRAVNAEIRRLVEESGCAKREEKKPPLPETLPASRDLNGKLLLLATPLSLVEDTEGPTLISMALPWRTMGNLVPDPLEALIEASDETLTLERPQEGEDILAFLMEEVGDYYRALEQVIDSGEAALYFGSIESLTSAFLKNANPVEVIRGIAKLSKRQFRVAIIRIGSAILILGLCGGIAAGTYKLLAKTGGALGEVVARKLMASANQHMQKK